MSHNHILSYLFCLRFLEQVKSERIVNLITSLEMRIMIIRLCVMG